MCGGCRRGGVPSPHLPLCSRRGERKNMRRFSAFSNPIIILAVVPSTLTRAPSIQQLAVESITLPGGRFLSKYASDLSFDLQWSRVDFGLPAVRVLIRYPSDSRNTPGFPVVGCGLVHWSTGILARWSPLIRRFHDHIVPKPNTKARRGRVATSGRVIINPSSNPHVPWIKEYTEGIY